MQNLVDTLGGRALGGPWVGVGLELRLSLRNDSQTGNIINILSASLLASISLSFQEIQIICNQSVETRSLLSRGWDFRFLLPSQPGTD